ncbi:MAG: HAD family phosphatase [Spirochaetales bacterium]|nr:HAD family phosphatase [Spirochaetales bacterium]
MVKAVIFDMDGVLVDSEPLHYESEKKALARYGLTFNRNIHRKYIGYSNERTFWRDLIKEFGVSLNIDTLILEKKEYFNNHLHKIKRIDPAYTLLNRLKKAAIPCAIASSSSHELIRSLLDQCALNDFFSVIQSGDDVEFGKPHPDIFLEAAKKLGIHPRHCVVVEDSLHGVKAGHAAGMIVVAVPNEYTRMLDFSLAHHVIESLDEFDALGLLTIHS